MKTYSWNSKTVPERFHRHYRVDAESGCWLWVGSKNKGYGRLIDDKPGTSPLYAHRVSYELHHGPIPPGMFVCHSCDVPGCVNPDHLWAGSAKDNSQDALSKGRVGNNAHFTVGHKARGEKAGPAKLKEWQAQEILDSTKPTKELMRLYGVSYGAIYAIRTRMSWKHLEKS